jgi:hypothetical protein
MSPAGGALPGCAVGRIRLSKKANMKTKTARRLMGAGRCGLVGVRRLSPYRARTVLVRPGIAAGLA